jgi:hypothetical protein
VLTITWCLPAWALLAIVIAVPAIAYWMGLDDGRRHGPW